jgi:hypothetical protein
MLFALIISILIILISPLLCLLWLSGTKNPPSPIVVGEGEPIPWYLLDKLMQHNGRNIGPEYLRLWKQYRSDSGVRVELRDIPGTMKYRPNTKISRPTQHWGQRKLFLSELQFLTECWTAKVIRQDQRVYFVYAGAADGKHICELLRYFPSLIFILVDPEKFFLTCTSAEMCRVNSSEVVEKIRASASAPVEKQTHFYIINELFTNELAQRLRELGEAHPLLFISDIRTTSKEKAPEDLDILWNLAQQYNWWRLLRPAAGLLKFRLPWYSELEQIPETIQADFDRVRDQIDFLADYQKHQLTYFSGTVLLQAFSPKSSTETRLLVWGESAADTAVYLPENYDDHFFFYNNIDRGYIIHDNPYADRALGFDHCNDCALEAHIWQRYHKEVKAIYIRECIERLSHVLRRNFFEDGHGKLFPDSLAEVAQGVFELIEERENTSEDSSRKHRSRRYSRPSVAESEN